MNIKGKECIALYEKDASLKATLAKKKLKLKVNQSITRSLMENSTKFLNYFLQAMHWH